MRQYGHILAAAGICIAQTLQVFVWGESMACPPMRL
jgi:hypothetical protein